jgi:serine-protein kinase ATM
LLSMESSFHALSIAASDSNKMSKYMYSFVSLLFSCAGDNYWSKDIDFVAEQASNGIPSFRFVELYSQLLSRLGSSRSDSERSLHSHLTHIVSRVTDEHPYHCTMQLVSASKSRDGEASQSGKAQVASEILVSLSKADAAFKGRLIESQSHLFDAYVDLALADSEKFQRGTTQISFDNICKGAKARLDRLPFVVSRAQSIAPCVSTKVPDIRPRCDYGNGETDPVGSERIQAFDAHFTIAASGLSRPKIVVCLGMKGGQYKQLVKGGDDTRQDAVMEQVFQYVNTLLRRERESRQKQGELSVVTYHVIPMTPKAGVSQTTRP